MLYENADPFRLREPAGTLDTCDATYSDVGDGRVRVEGSRFEPAEQLTIKLEGSARRGYQTVSLVGIRDPLVVASIKEWSSGLLAALAKRVQSVLRLDPSGYQAELRRYGADAILGPAEPEAECSHEIGVILKVSAPDQTTATAIAKLANTLMLHMTLPGMIHLPSFAFMTSPLPSSGGRVVRVRLGLTGSPTPPAWLTTPCRFDGLGGVATGGVGCVNL
jgi:hypothetical protein